MRRTVSLLGVCAMILGLMTVRRTAAQDAPPAIPGGAAGVVDKIMGLVGNGQIDQAVPLMDVLKNQPDLREDARTKLLRLRDGQLGTYRGYDIATTIRFSPRLQTLDVLAYYDQQPVLLRFEFYHPQASDAVPWSVLDFRVDTDVAAAIEVLREDAPGIGVGRGGRATR